MDVNTKVYIEMPDGTEDVYIYEGKQPIPEGITEMWVVDKLGVLLSHHKGVNIRSVVYEESPKLP